MTQKDNIQGQKDKRQLHKYSITQNDDVKGQREKKATAKEFDDAKRRR